MMLVAFQNNAQRKVSIQDWNQWCGCSSNPLIAVFLHIFLEIQCIASIQQAPAVFRVRYPRGPRHTRSPTQNNSFPLFCHFSFIALQQTSDALLHSLCLCLKSYSPGWERHDDAGGTSKGWLTERAVSTHTHARTNTEQKFSFYFRTPIGCA